MVRSSSVSHRGRVEAEEAEEEGGVEEEDRGGAGAAHHAVQERDSAVGARLHAAPQRPGGQAPEAPAGEDLVERGRVCHAGRRHERLHARARSLLAVER